MEMDMDMDIEEDPIALQEEIQRMRKIEHYKRSIIEKNYQIRELNKANDVLQVRILYNSLTYFYKDHIAVYIKRATVDPELINYINELKEKTDYDYNQYKISNEFNDETMLNILKSDFDAFSKVMEHFFNIFKNEKIIETDETYVEPYLTRLFFSNIGKQEFKKIADLKNRKADNDKRINHLSHRISMNTAELTILEKPLKLTPEELQLQQEQIQEKLPQQLEDLSQELTKLGFQEDANAGKQRPKTPHLFILACHGTSVSQFKNYFRTRIYFKNVEFIAPFSEKIFMTLGDLEYSLKNSPDPVKKTDIDKYLNAHRTRDNARANEVIVSDDQYAYLPPMMFTPITTGESEEVTKLFDSIIGLYHYALFYGSYHLVHIVADHKTLVENLSGGFLTYSTIASLTRNYFKSIKDDTITLQGEKRKYIEKNVKSLTEKELFDMSSLSFISCRNYYYKELVQDKDVLNFFNSTIVIHHDPKKATFFEDFNKDENGNDVDNVSLFVIDSKELDIRSTRDRWKGVVNKTYNQGCGFNILNFYGLMNITEARGRTTCITLETSIFKIADFITRNNSQYSPISGFGVCRMPIKYYFRLLSTLNKNVASETISTSLAHHSLKDNIYLFHMYETNFRDQDETMYNEIGHFVSICIKDNIIYFIDPLKSIFIEKQYDVIASPNEDVFYTFLENILDEKYNTYNFCDFFIFKNKMSPLTFKEITKYGGVLRKRPVDLKFGGGRKRHNSRNTHHAHGNRTHHAHGNRTHKNRTHNTHNEQLTTSYLIDGRDVKKMTHRHRRKSNMYL